LKLIEEMSYDLDFNDPKLIISEKLAVIENVKAIVMISETSLTVQCGKKHVTVTGSDFVIKEIFEGRLLIEGKIQGIEFFRTSGKDKD
jgi:sporulation protein YqfC